MDEMRRLELSKPTSKLTASSPHQAEWYVRSRVNELCGVSLYVFYASRVARYAFLCRGMSRAPARVKIGGGCALKYRSEARDYIERCRRSYAGAMPEYERKRLAR